MNTLSIMYPYEYASNLVNLSWCDIREAIEKGFMLPQAAIEHAISKLVEENNPIQLIDLACSEKNDYIQPYINYLSDLESNVIKEQVNDKLLYILLNWVHENREKYSDVLEVIEIIYSDFDYPDKISKFVRYMPMSQPDLGSSELNTQRLLTNWEEYLSDQKDMFAE